MKTQSAIWELKKEVYEKSIRNNQCIYESRSLFEPINLQSRYAAVQLILRSPYEKNETKNQFMVLFNSIQASTVEVNIRNKVGPLSSASIFSKKECLAVSFDKKNPTYLKHFLNFLAKEIEEIDPNFIEQQIYPRLKLEHPDSELMTHLNLLKTHIEELGTEMQKLQRENEQLKKMITPNISHYPQRSLSQKQNNNNNQPIDTVMQQPAAQTRPRSGSCPN